MPRARNPNRDKAKQIYLEHKGDIELVDIAKKLDTPPGTIRGWKNKDKWDSGLNGTFQTKKTERSKTKINKKKQTIEPMLDVGIEELENSSLNDNQRLFCIYYVKYRNATKAYQRAYGCKYSTAMTQGCLLLRKPKVKNEIEKLKKTKLQQAWFDKDDLIQKHIDIALADITDYTRFGTKKHLVNPEAVKDGVEPVYIDINYLEIHDSENVDGTLISEISQSKNGIKIKLVDKKQSLEFLKSFTGLIDPVTNEKLEIERQKLEMAKAKENYGEDDEGTGVVILPDVKEMEEHNNE